MTDSSSWDSSSNVAVVVEVVDTNDHAPEWISSNVKEIRAGTELGVPFHRLLAVDKVCVAVGKRMMRQREIESRERYI